MKEKWLITNQVKEAVNKGRKLKELGYHTKKSFYIESKAEKLFQVFREYFINNWRIRSDPILRILKEIAYAFTTQLSNID